MGYPTKSSTRGNFYLRTGDESPFGLGEKGLKYDGEGGVVNNVVSGGQHVARGISTVGGKLLG